MSDETQYPTEYVLRAHRSSPFGSFLAGFAWDTFATFTPNRPASAAFLVRRFHAMMLEASKLAGVTARWFYIVERSLSGFCHIHALIWTSGKLTPDQIRSLWRYGVSHARPYDNQRGGAFYLAVDVESGRAEEYDLSEDMPPRLFPSTESLEN